MTENHGEATARGLEPSLDTQDVADLLKVSKRQVRRLMSSGELVADFKVGARKRFHPETIRAFMGDGEC